MVHIQTFGYIPSLLFYLGRYFFSTLPERHPFILPTMEVPSHQRQHFFLIAVDVGTECLVAIRAELLDDAVYHGRAEHVMLFEDVTLLFQASSRSIAAVRKLGQILQLVGIFLLMDVDIHVGAFGNVERIVQLEAIAASHGKTGDELVQVGRAVR